MNKLIDKMNRYRIDAVKEANKPVEEFQNKLKELTNSVKETKELVEKPIKQWEQKQRDNRQVEIDSIIIDHGEGYPIEIRDSWFNKTTKVSHIVDDVKSIVREMKQAEAERAKHIETIENTAKQSNLTPEGYLHLLDLGIDILDIIQQIQEDGAKKQEVVEYNNEFEENKKRLEASKPKEEAAKDEAVFRRTLVIEATDTQAVELLEFMKGLGIEFWQDGEAVMIDERIPS